MKCIFTVIKIYNSHLSFKSKEVQKEIRKHLSRFRYKLEDLSAAELNEGYCIDPIIVLCTNDTRLRLDIENALSHVKSE